MISIRALLLRPIVPRLTAAEFASWVLSGAGILTLILGIRVMPSLRLSETGIYVALLVLVGFMFIAHAAGQLTVIADELKQLREIRET